MSILAVGTVAFDRIETPFGKRDRALGGSAMYITMAARFFTPQPRIVAVVGGDFPKEFMDILESSGVDLSGLEISETGKTFAWGGKYHYDLNNRDTLYTDLNVLSSFSPVLPPSFEESRVVCLGNLDPSVQLRVLDQAVSPGFVVCDTMNFWIEGSPDTLRQVLARVDCLAINDSEARELSGEPNLVRAARRIHDMGPDIVIVKKGEHGALLFMEDEIFAVPAYPLEDIQDPTGAGDAFMGGFAGYLDAAGSYGRDDLKHALVYGSAIASYCVESFGPERLLNLSMEDIEGRINAFRDLTTIPAPVLLARS